MTERAFFDTTQIVIEGVEESEDTYSRGGRDPFEYLRKEKGLVDIITQRALATHGIATCLANRPLPLRACFDSFYIVIRTTPCRINGVTGDSGTLILIPAHTEIEMEQEAGIEYGLDTDWRFVQPLTGMRTPPSSVVAVPIDPRIRLRLQTLVDQGLKGEDFGGGILAEAFKPFSQGPDRLITPGKERTACRARDLIDATLDSKVCLSRVCEELGVNIRTVERAFRIRFQETMSDYVKHTRLEKARDLLLTGMTVTDAMLDVGWTHPGRFSREFKKRFGENPSTFQKAAGASLKR